MFGSLKSFIVLVFCAAFFAQNAYAVWEKQKSNTLAWLYDVYFTDEKTGWIAGSDGTLLKTADGGAIWRQERKFTGDSFRQIYFTDEKHGWILCERGIYNRGALRSSYLLKTADGGTTWEKSEFTETGRERISRVLFDRYGSGLAFGESGALLSLKHTEKEWKILPSPVRYLLIDGVFTDFFNGVVVGGGGTILFTEDAGTSWKQANVFGDKSAKFNSVYFYNQKNGWAAGTGGKIFQTTSSGKTWREQSSGTVKNINDIIFLNSAEGFAVGDEGTILYTTTAGNVWKSQASGDKHKLEKIYCGGKKCFAVGFGGTILTYETN